MDNKEWYVLYTRPQREKIVHKQLNSWYGLESWCPFKKVRRQWSDRVKLLEIPMFKGYVFVKVEEKQRVRPLTLDGVINYVHYLRRPAVIRDEDMTELKHFFESHNEIDVHQPGPGDSVILTQGAFKGREGIIKTVLKNKVILDFPQLGFSLEASLDAI